MTFTHMMGRESDAIGAPLADSNGTARRFRGSPRSWRKVAVRVAIAAALIAGLFYYFDFSKIVAHLASIDPEFVGLALLILAGQYLLSCVRWHYILRRHSLPLTFHRAFSIYGIGALANLVALNAIAGLSVRGMLLARDGASASRAIGALLVERLAAVGGMGLCLAGGIGLSYPVLLRFFGAAQTTSTTLWIAGAMALAALAAVVVLWRFQVVRAFASEVRESFLSFRALAYLAVASAGIVLLGFGGVAALAHGMSLDIDPVFFISVMPAVAFVAALPISIGGWGVREGMMVAGLALFSVPGEAAVALSLIYGLAGVLLATCFGAIALLLYALERRARLKTEQPESDN